MRWFLAISTILLINISFAQHKQGDHFHDIYLKDGKTILGIDIHSVTDRRVTYLLKNNLHDIAGSDIAYITWEDHYVVFTSQGLEHRTFDHVINEYNVLNGICLKFAEKYEFIEQSKPANKIRKINPKDISKCTCKYGEIVSGSEGESVFKKIIEFDSYDSNRSLNANESLPSKQSPNDGFLFTPIDTGNTIATKTELIPTDTSAAQGVKSDSSQTNEATRIEKEIVYIHDTIVQIEYVKDDYCYESFRRGKVDGRKVKTLGWGIGSYFATFSTFNFASGFAPTIAETSNIPIIWIPRDVDKTCYTEGYVAEVRRKRVKAATYGTLGGNITWIIIMGIALASSL